MMGPSWTLALIEIRICPLTHLCSCARGSLLTRLLLQFLPPCRLEPHRLLGETVVRVSVRIARRLLCCDGLRAITVRRGSLAHRDITVLLVTAVLRATTVLGATTTAPLVITVHRDTIGHRGTTVLLTVTALQATVLPVIVTLRIVIALQGIRALPATAVLQGTAVLPSTALPVTAVLRGTAVPPSTAAHRAIVGHALLLPMLHRCLLFLLQSLLALATSVDFLVRSHMVHIPQ